MAALVQGVRGALVISSCVLRSTLTKSAVVGLTQKCLHTNSLGYTKPCKVVSSVIIQACIETINIVKSLNYS